MPILSEENLKKMIHEYKETHLIINALLSLLILLGGTRELEGLIFFTCILFVIWMRYIIYVRSMDHFLSFIREFHERSYQKISFIHINEILKRTEGIHKNYLFSAFLRKLTFRYFDMDATVIFEKSMFYMSSLLKELKNNLIITIEELQKSLESAKTEVENTITGTPELLAVSEAQQVRLERQIEQFEELQRVLVRA